MGGLHEHFQQSGYTAHRSMLRWERLPACCRSGLRDLPMGIKHLDGSGREIVLPLQECPACGRRFAVWGAKYLPIVHLLKFEVVPLE